MDHLPILILAAGASRRMRGRDKLLEPVQNRPILRYVADVAQRSGHPTAVTLPTHGAPARWQALADLEVTKLAVDAPEEGMNASLRVGLQHFRTAEAVMILLADMPEITVEHLHAVFAARDIAPQARAWRGTTEQGAPGHPTLIDHRLFDAIIALQGDVGAQPVLRSAPVHLVPLAGQVAQHDLDTPEAWEAWRNRD